jgi:hypothetical protein
MALKCRPQMRRTEPGYPSSRETAADPTILLRNVPPAGRGRGELRGALALLLGTGALGSNSGCTFGVPAAIEPLTERDAVRIVKAELSQRGIQRVDEKIEIPGVLMANPAGQKEPLVVDLADPERKWAVEYLSWRELRRFARPTSEGLGQFAGRLEAEVTAQAPGTHLKVLYAESMSPRDQAKAAAREEQELRRQIREFFDWLAAQGAI